MNYLRLILCLSLFALTATTSSALSDLPAHIDGYSFAGKTGTAQKFVNGKYSDKSIRILVAKSDDVTAKITIGSQTYLAPVQFEDNSFSWNDVKDSYSITPAFASLIEQGRVSIYIGCSGASFSVIPHHAKKK